MRQAARIFVILSAVVPRCQIGGEALRFAAFSQEAARQVVQMWRPLDPFDPPAVAPYLKARIALEDPKHVVFLILSADASDVMRCFVVAKCDGLHVVDRAIWAEDDDVDARRAQFASLSAWYAECFPDVAVVPGSALQDDLSG